LLRLLFRSCPRRDLRFLTTRPIAHRGLHDRAAGRIENSSGAFAAAMAHDYPIECDIRLTGDGGAVVFHDERLDRLTGETGPVAARPLAELTRIPLMGSSDRIPALAELLEQVAGRVLLLIELKSAGRRNGELLTAVLAGLLGYRGPLAVMSFDSGIVAGLKERAPEVIRGIVADRVIDRQWRPLSFAERLALRGIAHLAQTRPQFLSFEAAGLPSAASRLFHEAGLPVLSWTVRSEAEARRARRYCDQITFEGFLPR
jgi:glycerophosphoryl diester phosphodiesterase